MANRWKLIRNLQQYAIVVSCCRIAYSSPASNKFANTLHNNSITGTGINHFKPLSRSLATAAAAAAGRHPKMTDSLSKVVDVDIDGNGTFKYILIRVYGPDKGGNDEPASKLIVRGYQRASYHVDIYEEVQAKQLKPLGLECECEGGGRIKHDRDERRLLVYGYSQGFGRAQHQLAVDLLKVTYPDYEVTWTNDGY